MRKYLRALARARLQEMDVDHINEKFGAGIPHAKERKLQRHPGAYQQALKRRKFLTPPPAPAVWRRVLWGDLAKLYENGKKQRQKA